jgi:hypothetical protein
MAEMMELFAKQSDCDRISMLMRPGWKKIMPTIWLDYETC